jgi:tripeptidyl-peptidase I
VISISYGGDEISLSANYQKRQCDEFKKLGLQGVSVVVASGFYNAAGRGYPDVAAIGDNVLIHNAGVLTLIRGTSAAAPVFAAILTRINEELLAKKGTTVGFVNPTLYVHPEVFNDITSGRSNPGCGTDGFKTAPGWDPVTGLGTPNYPALLALFLGE